MTEWKAELPEVHESRVANCDAMDVNTLVTRANEELAKVRAERDAALAQVRGLTELRPLGEASRDGSPILVWLQLEDDPVIMRWCPRGKWWNACRDSEGEIETFRDDALLGWLPLPKPSKATHL